MGSRTFVSRREEEKDGEKGRAAALTGRKEQSGLPSWVAYGHGWRPRLPTKFQYPVELDVNLV